MGWWFGLAPTTQDCWVRLPTTRNQGKQAHRVKVLGFSTGPPPSLPNSCIIGPAVISNNNRSPYPFFLAFDMLQVFAHPKPPEQERHFCRVRQNLKTYCAPELDAGEKDPEKERERERERESERASENPHTFPPPLARATKYVEGTRILRNKQELCRSHKS